MRWLPTPRAVALALLNMNERGIPSSAREVAGVFGELDDTGQAVLSAITDEDAAAWAADMLASPNRPIDCAEMIDVTATAQREGHVYNVALSMALGDAINRHTSLLDTAGNRLKRVLAAGLTHGVPCFNGSQPIHVSVTLRYFDGFQWRNTADLKVAIEPRAADDLTPCVVIRLAHE